MISVNLDGSVTAQTSNLGLNGYIHLYADERGYVYAWTNAHENPTCLKVSSRFDTVMLIQFENKAFADEYFEEHPLAGREYLIWFGK